MNAYLAGLVVEPLPWAVERIRKASQGGHLPLYGSAAWHDLPAGDPRRWAAVIVAAECWRDHRSPGRVALDMRRALSEADALMTMRLKDAAVDVAQAADWSAIAGNPPHAELVRRRSA